MARKTLKFEMNPLLGGPTLEARTRSGSPYRLLPLAEIDVDPDQPRRVFDTEALAELAASIKEHGILCPILVKVTAGGTYRVVAGERRLRASRLIGLESIPAVIDADDGDDNSTLAKQLVENLQREDLSAIERALAVGQLRDRYGWSVREIAKKLGASKSLVQRSLDVLALPEDLREALQGGASESKILLLQQIADRETRKVLLERVDELTRAELELEIQRILSSDDDTSVSHRGTESERRVSAKRTHSMEDRRIIDDIQRSLGTKVDIIRSARKDGVGRLVLDFYAAEDLEELYRRLT